MSTVAVVTGANQGLGLALVRGLCRQWGPTGVVYLTARDRDRGEAAVARLATEGLSPRFALVDVDRDDSVGEFVARIAREHGGVDVVLGNAARRISPDLPNADQVRAFVETNNHGTRRLIATFGPLLNDGGRFVVVASALGRLRNLAEPLRARFDVDRLSLSDVDSAVDDYVTAVEDGTATAQGWPEWINIVSKIGQVAATKVMARDMAAEAGRRDILINAACPGLLDTEASRPWFADMSQALSVDQGAVDVLWLATRPSGTRSPYGELVQHREVLTF